VSEKGMKVDLITIFPEMFPAVLGASILKRAQERGLLQMTMHDLRDYTHDKRRTVDDRPYGGGPGMVMKPEPIFDAIDDIRRSCGHPQPPSPHLHSARRAENSPPANMQVGGCLTILMSPQGEPLSSDVAKELAAVQHLTIICGHYEGVDERVRLALVDRAISVGDYVLTGGELPAMVLLDCLARFVPGVIGHEQATEEESFAAGWLEYPHYTRPPVFRGMAVPEVLRCGDHEQVARWRTLQSVARTWACRPDLMTSNGGHAASPKTKRHVGTGTRRRSVRRSHQKAHP